MELITWPWPVHLSFVFLLLNTENLIIISFDYCLLFLFFFWKKYKRVDGRLKQRFGEEMRGLNKGFFETSIFVLWIFWCEY